ncbi:hypothetical protein T484DRAFT_1754914, partial [Baffinella frigidus]
MGFMDAMMEDGPPPPYCDASPSAPTMAEVAVPTVANSMGLADKLRELEKAEAAGLLNPSELKAARQRTIDGFIGVSSSESLEAGAPIPQPIPDKGGYSTCTGAQIKL